MAYKSEQRLLAADTWIQLLDNATGLPKGELLGVICADLFDLTTSVTELPVPGKCIGGYNQNLEVYNIPNPVAIQLVLKDVSSKLLAMGLLSEVTTRNVPALNLAGVDFDLVGCEWTLIDVDGVDPGTLSVAGSVEGVDFEVDYNFAAIRAIVGGNLDGGTTAVPVVATVTASRAAATVDKLVILSNLSVTAQITMIGRDLKTDKKVKLFLPEVNLASNGAISLIGDTPITTNLNGSILTGGTIDAYMELAQ